MNNKYAFLPQPIAAYFQACDAYDAALLADCFAPDAILRDEGMEHVGPEAISRHILNANREAKVSFEITDHGQQNGEVIVTATLTGEFEGSPLPLDFHFTLAGGKIRVLNITLEGE